MFLITGARLFARPACGTCAVNFLVRFLLHSLKFSVTAHGIFL